MMSKGCVSRYSSHFGKPQGKPLPAVEGPNLAPEEAQSPIPTMQSGFCPSTILACRAFLREGTPLLVGSLRETKGTGQPLPFGSDSDRIPLEPPSRRSVAPSLRRSVALRAARSENHRPKPRLPPESSCRRGDPLATGGTLTR